MSVQPAFWTRRRVLVTGHSGFKGAWLSLWLQAMGAEVSGLSREPPSSPSLYELASVSEGMAREHAADVRDAQALARTLEEDRPEVVLHLAAQPLVRRGLREPRETYEINVMGTVNLLDAVRRSGGVRAVVVVTSDKCYENTGSGRPFHESDPMGGSDPYSSSKGCAELVTAAFRRSFFNDGASARVASARAGNVIGGGDWGEDRLLPDLLRAAEAGRAARVRNPQAVRPWQHVLDPLAGYLRLAEVLCEDPTAARAWNFGPPAADARPVRFLVERLAELWPGGLRWETDAGSHPPEASTLTLDSSPAVTELGWSPRWGLEQALERIVEWHRAHVDGEDLRSVSRGQIDAYLAS